MYKSVKVYSFNGKRPLGEAKRSVISDKQGETVKKRKLSTRKEIVFMETYKKYFNRDYYLPDTQKLSFYIANVCILVTDKCGNLRCDDF